MQNKAIVYFGNHLPPEQFADDAARNHLIANGLELLATMRDLRVLTRLSALCAVVVSGSDQSLRELDEKLQQSQLGSLSRDQPDAVRAAK